MQLLYIRLGACMGDQRSGSGSHVYSTVFIEEVEGESAQYFKVDSPCIVSVDIHDCCYYSWWWI